MVFASVIVVDVGTVTLELLLSLPTLRRATGSVEIRELFMRSMRLRPPCAPVVALFFDWSLVLAPLPF